MKRFTFRLERLLKLKDSLEERKKNEINKLLADINAINVEIKNKEKQIDRELEELSKLLVETHDVRLTLDWHSYISGLDEEKKEFEQRRMEKEKELQKKIKEYMQLLKEKKILVNLRERKYLEYLKEIDRIERSYLDEQALSGFRRRKIG